MHAQATDDHMHLLLLAHYRIRLHTQSVTVGWLSEVSQIPVTVRTRASVTVRRDTVDVSEGRGELA